MHIILIIKKIVVNNYAINNDNDNGMNGFRLL